jgi:hypothetical protein
VGGAPCSIPALVKFQEKSKEKVDPNSYMTTNLFQMCSRSQSAKLPKSNILPKPNDSPALCTIPEAIKVARNVQQLHYWFSSILEDPSTSEASKT